MRYKEGDRVRIKRNDRLHSVDVRVRLEECDYFLTVRAVIKDMYDNPNGYYAMEEFDIICHEHNILGYLEEDISEPILEPIESRFDILDL